MKVVLDMSISLNGMIARENGSEDWLPEEGWDDFVIKAKKYNNIVMGRETYEQVMTRYKDANFNDVKCKYKVIITNQSNFQAPGEYTILHSPEDAIKFIKEKGLKTLFLIGGGKLNTEFMKRGLIDEIHLTINPHIIGKGRQFLNQDEFEASLSFIKCKELPNGRIQLQYKVESH